ncbi:unnamed protein product [Caenorhabditis auriculariae]|uniref:Peptidase M1 membrane alanine aminopeptidase domain-containing protein n=1 Tax=Caenorhabditis auriculariae TaxID=2777116 RepID=A0A8S1H3E0_9PELO|nr:unnamed protein product [Caenorhabditis auriculariae]
MTLLLFLLLAAPSLAKSGLSSHIVPLAYDLMVKLPIREFNGFTASMVLHFNLTALTDNITLHSVDLHSFRNISIISGEFAEPQLKSIRILRQTVEFKFATALLPGQYLLTIGEYNGRINNGSFGVIHRNNSIYTTHFQPNHARRLMPCIDHPSVKSTFRISVLHRTNTVAQSNTIANDVQVEDQEWQKTTFAATPQLPAYLISFSILPDTNLQLSRQTSFGVTVRVNGRVRGTVLRVLDCALAAFELLATIVDVPLPLNKLDFILLPNYDGGMENWGHVVLSESLAELGDDAHLIYIVAHEIAHHWVGNKATIDSWQFICLQEDLADWLAMKTVKTLLTDDEMYSRFKLSQYVEIQLAEDFLSPNHSLLMPEEIDQEMISTHCYLKGVVMLETLENVVGEAYMLSVVKNIVSLHTSYNLQTFLGHFDEIRVDRNATLAQIFEYWFTQGGFPSVLVENNGPSSRLQQMTKPLWPLRMTSTLSLPEFVFSESIVFASESAPLLVNLNFTSFMRINYDPLTWTSIFRYMLDEPQLFSPVGRAQLISDFCYFNAHKQIVNGSLIRNAVVDMVYAKPEYFELCDWNLYWCHSTTDVSLFSKLVRRLALGFTVIFESSAAFGCRNGMAVRGVNTFCETLFGVKCV